MEVDRTAAADGVEETGSSFTWESHLLSRVNAHQPHQEMSSLMEGATSMKCGVSTECAVTIVKETGVFEKLLMEKLSAYMCPIIGISSLNGWLLVHFWEGDSYAVDLGALSPGSNQGMAHPGTKIAGGTPDNIHKWAIIHSVGKLLSDDSILKVVYDVLHLSHTLGENAGLKIVRVFDILEADRIIRGHIFLMPLAELLQIYGMVPYSCVDIVIGSQRTPVVDDPMDYCGKSQRQAINNLREMAQVSSKMIPFLYQAMLSIMSAPMLAELNQRSNASMQSPQQLDCWYNPRRGDMVSGPGKVPSHPSSYAAALEGMATTGNESIQQAPSLVKAIESYTEEAKYDRTEVQKQNVTQKELQHKHQDETQEQHQQVEEMQSVELDTTSQKESHSALHLVTSNNGKETKQQPHFDCNAKKTVQKTYANALQVKAECLTENAIMKQAPPRLTQGDETSEIEETSDESTCMYSQDLPPKKQNHQVQKHDHHENCGSQSKEQVNCPQVASAKGENVTRPSVAASNEKKKQQENSLDKSVKPKTNQSASSAGAVATTSAHQKQQQQPEQLQECIQTSRGRKSRRRTRKRNKMKKEQNQMPPEKMQYDVKPKKSSVTSAFGPANPQEQTGPSKSPLSLGVPVQKEKNQLKVKVQNYVKPKESRGMGTSGPAKTKEQPKQSKNLLSSTEREKGKMPQQGVWNDVRRKNNSAPKAKDQSHSSKNPFVSTTVKKEQNTLPQQKTQNGVKPKKSSVTLDKTSAKTREQNSSSKSCPSPGATNRKVQNQMPQPKEQNDKKAEKSSVTSASGPFKAKEQPSKQDNHQQKQQKYSEANDAVKPESKKKKESSQKFSDEPACLAKTGDQNSSSKSCPSPGATNRKEQNQMPQPKVQNDKKAEKNSDIGASGLANTNDQAYSSKSSHTPREVVKKEQNQVSYQKSQNHVESKKYSVTSASGPVKAKEQPSKQDKHQQKQQENSEVNDAMKAESKKKESSQKFSDKPALKTEKEHIKSEMSHDQQQPTLLKDCPAEKRESDASTSSINFTEQAGRQELKDFQKNDQVLSYTTTKPKGLPNQQQNAEKEDMSEQFFQHEKFRGADLMTSSNLAHTPQQQQQQNTNVQQQYHQTHQQQQQQNTNVQQQNHQIHQQQQQNTNVHNPAPGIIPQVPMGVMLQALTLPPQQVTFVQWEPQVRQRVKTSPETKVSTSPQWMKPMVLQFEEGNTPFFIHPLSEQASIPINPCHITDEQDEEFDDLLVSDVTKFVEAFPASIQLALQQLSQESSSYSFTHLAEVVLDVGRKPKAWYLKSGSNYEMMEKVLNHDELTKQDLKGILKDNSFVKTCKSQVMVRDTLHRLGLLANIQGEVIGITAKVEHPLPGCLSPLYDIFNKGKSILVVGPTGVGKTTLLREAARVLSDVEKKNVIVIDTLSEIAGEGDIPHQSIGSARRLQVIESNLQHKVMSEAYQNHRPEIVIIDEISSLEDAEKTLDMKLQGIQLIVGVQGQTLTDVLLNTSLTPITGGIKEGFNFGTPGGMTGRLRTGPVVFDVLVEMLEMERWIIHWDFHWAIDAVLLGGKKNLGVEERKVVKLEGDPDGGLVGQQVLAMQMCSTYTIYTQ